MIEVNGGPPAVTFFSLGGTIASAGDPEQREQGVSPRLEPSDLLESVPGIDSVAQLKAVSFLQCPSGDIHFADLVRLAEAIERCFNDGDVGVVVSQGTDTIEETAFALALLVGKRGPVVITGAMRNATLPGADGPSNISAAVRVAASPTAAGLGCVVVMNNEIHDPSLVQKTHTSSVASFASRLTGPIGWVSEANVRVLNGTRTLPTLRMHGGPIFPRIALLTVSLSDDGRLIEVLGSLGYEGLVVEGFGGGHVASSVASSLGTAVSSMPVVLASRAGVGEMLKDTYSFPGSERDLAAKGIVSAGILDGPKARILLTLLLASSESMDDPSRAFTQCVNRLAEFDDAFR